MELDKTGLEDRTFGISSMTNPRAYSFMRNLNTGVSRWSENAVEYFGLENEYTANAAEEWEKLIYPDDIEYYRKSYQDILDGKVTAQNFEYRIRNREGNYVLVTCQSVVLPGKDGDLICLRGQ